MTLILTINRQSQVIYFSFSEIRIIITSLFINRQVEGSLTSNFKIISQGHVIYFNIFRFYDLNMLKTTPTSLLYHVYIKRYLD